jgi:hypothetical protein
MQPNRLKPIARIDARPAPMGEPRWQRITKRKIFRIHDQTKYEQSW